MPERVDEELRQRAEEQLGAPAPVDASLHLLHELQVHRIELEMQNEELRRTQMALEESLARYFDLYDLAPTGYVTVSEDGAILEANLAAAALLGPGKRELIGQPFTRFVLPEDQDIYYLHRRGLTPDGERRTAELRLRPSAAGPLWVRLESTLSEHAGGAAICRMALADVTQLKETAAELRIEKERAEAATRSKSQFLSSMSHEVRTPMNGIIGMIELLLDTALTTEQRAWAETVRHSGDALLVIINDILDFSKMEAGKLALEPVPFDLQEAMQGVVELMASKAREKGLELILLYAPGMPRHFAGDPGRVRQMLLNLVSNAIKFTERGHVLLEASGGGDSTPVRLSVHDSGPGIPVTRLDLLFERFQQLDASTTRRFGGTGLGLAIVRELAQMMGGSVSAVSTPGEGSSFTIEIPLPAHHGEVAQQAEPIDPAAVRIDGNKRVLLAEDNPVNRKVGMALLTKLGCQVDVAVDGEEAGRLARLHAYDVILMDCHMPVMDGYQATQEIRLRERGGRRRTPVVAVTANAMPEDREYCLAQGMDDYVTKPVSLRTLHNVLERWTG